MVEVLKQVYLFMRHQTRELVTKFIQEHGFSPKQKILDVGCMDINGTIRDLFPPGSYTGADMRGSGSGVDVIVNGHDLVKKFGLESFDIVTCFDTMEHDDKFWITIAQMKKVLKKGGWLIIGAPGRACPLHDYPGDYWRFMPESFASLLKGLGDVHTETEMQPSSELESSIYGYGQKI
jgi:SAM-dependent methyltransferase